MMKNKNIYLKKYSLLLSVIAMGPQVGFGFIDHKNTKLVAYLDQIRENLDEKAGIFDIIGSVA